MRAMAVSVPVVLAVVAAAVMASAQPSSAPGAQVPAAKVVAPIDGEWRLKNVRQLTFGGRERRSLLLVRRPAAGVPVHP